jgi:hypothetical protein
MNRVLLAAALLLLLVLAPAVRSGSAGAADAALWATAEALAERGTLAIDGSAEEYTPLRARRGEHWYATTPPVPALFAAGALRLGASRPVATFLVATVPVVLAALCAALLLRPAARGRQGAAALALVACATPLCGFGTVLSGLPLAAAGLGLCLLALRRGAVLAAGAGAGLCAACVPGATAIVLVLAPWRDRAQCARFLLAAAPALALHAAATYGTSGSLLGFDAAAARHPLAFTDLAALTPGEHPFGGGALDAWVGARGLVVHAPVVALGLVALVRAARRGAPYARPAALAALVLAVAGSLPEEPAASIVAEEHVLVVLLLASVFRGATWPQRSWARVGAVALLLVAAVGAARALRSPHFVWHVHTSLTPEARLGLAPTDGERLAAAQWDLAAVDRPRGRERLSTEFEARLDLIARGVLEGRRGGASELADLRRGLVTITDRLDREDAPVQARPLAHYWLARTHLAAGDLGRAEASLRTCLSLYPSFAEARALLDEVKLGR